MKTFFLLCFIIPISQAQISLKGYLPTTLAGKTITLSIRYSNIESVIVDSTVIDSQGSFSFRRPNQEVEYFVLSYNKSTGGDLMFVWDNDLIIKSKTENLFYADVEGSVLTKKLKSQESIFNKQLFVAIKPIQDSIDLGQKQYDIDKVHRFKALKGQKYGQFVRDVSAFIKTEPTFVGLYFLCEYWNSLTDNSNLLSALPVFLQQQNRGKRLGQQRETTKHASIGAMLPTFSAKTIDSLEISSNHLKGKAVVLDFWGTWCGPCLDILPELKKIHEKYSTNPNIVFVSIAAENEFYDPIRFRKFIKRMGMSWPQIAEPDGSTNLLEVFKIGSFPTIIISDKTGKIIHRASGDGQMAEVIEALEKISK
jgi:thiol-disulfide isomerase/thioredoxin